MQHGLYQCIVLCDCLPSPGSLCEWSFIVSRVWSTGYYVRGLQQVPTQGIANLVERWSFVILGEHIVEDANHMHYKREINYYNLSKIVIFFQHRNVHVLRVFSILRDK